MPLTGSAAEGADLRHVDTWLFDLDNTLYPLDSGLAPQMSALITDYVERLTGLPREDAHALQKKYLADHGLTLGGLMAHHGVDPDEFHRIFHDAPLDALIPDPALRRALARLPGRRIIFTNADDVHAARVLQALQLEGLFEEIFHIGSAAFVAKPHPDAFARLLAAHGVEPRTAAFFEDSERNLAPAAELGMTTVLVGPHAAASHAPFVHHRTEVLAPFLARALVKERPRP